MRKQRRILSLPFRIANTLTFGIFGWVVFFGKFLISIILAIWIIRNGALIQSYVGFDPSFWLGKLADWLEWFIRAALNWLHWLPTNPTELRAFNMTLGTILLWLSALFPAQLIVYSVVLVIRKVVDMLKWQLVLWFKPAYHLALWLRTLTLAEARDELVELCPAGEDPDAFVQRNLARFAKG